MIMQFNKLVEVETEVEININSSDLIAMMLSKQNPITEFEAREILNTCLGLLINMPDDLIKKLGEPSKKMIYSVMQSQISKYAPSEVSE